MIWLAAAILMFLALAPAGFALRRRIAIRGRTEASLALYRAQIVELDRDLAERRIAPAEHATAMLELQRRLLAASEAADRPGGNPDRVPLLMGLALVPILALSLYLVGGRPDLPSQPLAARQATREAPDAGQAVAQLRAALATLDPASKEALEGELLLGNVEASQGRFAQAAEAWRKALDQHFDPMLAAMVADATSQAEGRVSPASAALFRRALEEAPADAPWRKEVERRLAAADPATLANPPPVPR